MFGSPAGYVIYPALIGIALALCIAGGLGLLRWLTQPPELIEADRRPINMAKRLLLVAGCLLGVIWVPTALRAVDELRQINCLYPTQNPSGRASVPEGRTPYCGDYRLGALGRATFAAVPAITAGALSSLPFILHILRRRRAERNLRGPSSAEYKVTRRASPRQVLVGAGLAGAATGLPTGNWRSMLFFAAVFPALAGIALFLAWSLFDRRRTPR